METYIALFTYKSTYYYYYLLAYIYNTGTHLEVKHFIEFSSNANVTHKQIYSENTNKKLNSTANDFQTHKKKIKKGRLIKISICCLVHYVWCECSAS